LGLFLGLALGLFLALLFGGLGLRLAPGLLLALLLRSGFRLFLALAGGGRLLFLLALLGLGAQPGRFLLGRKPARFLFLRGQLPLEDFGIGPAHVERVISAATAQQRQHHDRERDPKPGALSGAGACRGRR